MDYSNVPLYLAELCLLTHHGTGERIAGLRPLGTDRFHRVQLPFEHADRHYHAVQYLARLDITVIGQVESDSNTYLVLNKPLT